MAYLLDTCVVSYLRKNIPPEVRDWFTSQDDEFFFLSVVTLAEIEDGISRLSPSQKKQDLEDWFYGSLQARFQERILPIDVTVARTWGQLNAKLICHGFNVGVQDLYLAATAKVHGLALVTVNVNDFENMDVVVINPWR